jgi:hypothetical protein
MIRKCLVATCSLFFTEYSYSYVGATQVWKWSVKRVFCAQFLTFLFISYDTPERVCYPTMLRMLTDCFEGAKNLLHKCLEANAKETRCCFHMHWCWCTNAALQDLR